MRQMLKHALRTVAPGIYGELASRRAHRRHHAAFTERGLEPVAERYLATFPLVVQNGPFAGMAYLPDSTGSALLPKLVGSYESELHPWIGEFRSRDYRVVIDIGCAEGYYAVGLARLLPAATVYAFDVDAISRKLCKKLARRNGVRERVDVRGLCSTSTFGELCVAGKTLVVCDCEGCEASLLDPAAAPSLKTADILAEMHDVYVPGISEEIAARFSQTHDIAVVATRKRDPAEFPGIQKLPEADWGKCLNEYRPAAMSWMLMRPRRS